ncbi:MAG: hypothetical protein J5772_02855 [Clostridia bacterium]|nr:hypothetical protein [Clostridia bacterium]
MNTAKRTMVFVLALMFVLACGCRQANDGIKVSSNSYFDRMIIKDDHICLICCVEFENDSDREKTFSVKGESSEDVKNGLLTSKELEFFILDTNDLSSVSEENIEQLLMSAESLTVGAHRTAKYYVCFVGDQGSGDSKHDRNLPKIVFDY